MPLFKRPDGTHIPVKTLGPYRRLFAFLMNSRTESTVFYAQEVDVTETLSWMKLHNTGLASALDKVSLFQIFLCACVRTLAQRPHLNRFVVGRRFYQRNSITFSFIVKKQISEQGANTNAKMDFSPFDTIARVGERLKAELLQSRAPAKTINEKEMDGFGKMPRPILAFFTWVFQKIDKLGLAPAFLIRPDPMFASAYIANLGSVGLPGAPFHPLFNWGTASLFLVMGTIKKTHITMSDGSLQIRDILPVNISLDNRVLDGLYAAKAIKLLVEYLQDPSQLQQSPELSPTALAELGLAQII